MSKCDDYEGGIDKLETENSYESESGLGIDFYQEDESSCDLGQYGSGVVWNDVAQRYAETVFAAIPSDKQTAVLEDWELDATVAFYEGLHESSREFYVTMQNAEIFGLDVLSTAESEHGLVAIFAKADRDTITQALLAVESWERERSLSCLAEPRSVESEDNPLVPTSQPPSDLRGM